jgi:acyl carrier protein
MTTSRTALPRLEDVLRLSADVVGVGALTADANFFEAGGDSVTAARLAVLLEERWDVPVDVFAIMAAEDLAEVHRDLLRTVRAAQPTRPAAGDVRTPSLNQQVRLEMDREVVAALGRRHAHTLAVAYRTTAELDPGRLSRALRAVARRHETLRSVFPAADRVVLLEDPEPAVSVRDAGSCAADAVLPALEEHARTSFDLAGAPPWSVLLLRHGDHCRVVSLAFDHLLLDGESIPVLLGDLAEAYDRDAGLPSARLSYYDWADRQRADQLPAAVAHAAPLARPENPGGALLPRLRLTVEADLGPSRLGQVRRTLPTEPVAALGRAAAAGGGTLFQALLGHWAEVVDRVRVPGPSGVVLSVANRTAETRDLVGWVANLTYLSLPAEPAAGLRAAFAGLGGISTVPLRTLQEHFWTGPEPVTRFPTLYVDLLRESPADRTPFGGRWERVDVPAAAFLLPGLSLWLRHLVDGSLTLTLAYDAGRLPEGAAVALLDDLLTRVAAAAGR